MARIVLTGTLIVLLNVLVGCGGADKGRGQLKPPRGSISTVIEVSSAAEADLIEQVALNRQTYQRALETLVEHYAKTGNDMKLQWAQKELDSLNVMAQYNYIVEASMAGPDLKAGGAIAAADELYAEAVGLHKKAKKLLVIKDKKLLRLALSKYNDVIRKYPTSDKIDDSAFKAAEIYQSFKDHSIALVYFQRAYQWDAATPYPARFKAAAILDRHLHRRDEALELYRQAVEIEGAQAGYSSWKEYAERRIGELTNTAEPPKPRRRTPR